LPVTKRLGKPTSRIELREGGVSANEA